jgi:4-hydroxybenzoate polyprenyltransferase
MTAIAISLKGYLDICRISNLPTVWTNVLCAFLLSTGSFSWGEFMVPAVAISFLYLAGMCLNDVCDYDFDRINRPGRPIPSGIVSIPGALFLAALLSGAGCTLLLKAQYRQGVLAALLLVALIIWYDLDHKGNPYSVLIMAGCRFLAFIVTALSVTDRLAAPVILAASLSFFYIVSLSMVARHENSRTIPFPFPVIPVMLAGISVLDGVLLALLVNGWWLAAGVAGGGLTMVGQRYVRGD